MNLRKLLYFILIVPFIMGGSCQKRKFEFTSNAFLNKTYNLDKTGTFTEFASVSDNEIRSFLDDLPEDAEVTDVTIKALSMRVTPISGNQISAISLTGLVVDAQSSEPIFVFEDYPVVLSAVNAPLVGLNNLIADGLADARKNIKDIIMGNKFGSFQLGLEGIPRSLLGGNRFVADVHIRISIQIEYEQCIEVWDYLDSGADCDL